MVCLGGSSPRVLDGTCDYGRDHEQFTNFHDFHKATGGSIIIKKQRTGIRFSSKFINDRELLKLSLSKGKKEKSLTDYLTSVKVTLSYFNSYVKLSFIYETFEKSQF
jgi:hypothetical protein